MNRLENKVAVITGASSGIGNSIARLFAAEGAKVVMFARREKELNDTAAEITANGGVAVVCPGDVSIQADVERTLNTAIEKFGKVDIVVNDAGMVRYNGGVAGRDRRRVHGTVRGKYHGRPALLPRSYEIYASRRQRQLCIHRLRRRPSGSRRHSLCHD